MLSIIKKFFIDLIPGLLFTFATIIINEASKHNDSYIIVGLTFYILGYASLNLHTYLINKLNNTDK